MIGLADLMTPVRNIENMCLDFWITHSGRLSPPGDIVVVAIDEPSLPGAAPILALAPEHARPACGRPDPGRSYGHRV